MMGLENHRKSLPMASARTDILQSLRFHRTAWRRIPDVGWHSAKQVVEFLSKTISCIRAPIGGRAVESSGVEYGHSMPQRLVPKIKWWELFSIDKEKAILHWNDTSDGIECGALEAVDTSRSQCAQGACGYPGCSGCGYLLRQEWDNKHREQLQILMMNRR